LIKSGVPITSIRPVAAATCTSMGAEGALFGALVEVQQLVPAGTHACGCSTKAQTSQNQPWEINHASVAGVEPPPHDSAASANS